MQSVVHLGSKEIWRWLQFHVFQPLSKSGDVGQFMFHGVDVYVTHWVIAHVLL